MVKALLLVGLISLSTYSHAETLSASAAGPLQSTIKADSLGNNKFAEDSNITDIKLRADSGSLSKYSMKFSLSFSGPPVGDLNNPMQPNPDGSPGTFETSLGGSLSARYRVSSSNAVSFGTGVSALTPFQGVKRYDIKNPFMSYDMSTRIFESQVRNVLGATIVTNPDWRAMGETLGLGLDNYWVYNLGSSKWAVEWDTSVAYYFYERGPNKKSKTEMKAGLYGVSFYPQLKYILSDKFYAYTSLNISFINPRCSEDMTVLWNRTLGQRVGLGYSLARNIYFAPYLNFYPKDFNLDATTVNFTTTFSML